MIYPGKLFRGTAVIMNFGIQGKQCRKIAGKFGRETILGILFEIFSVEYRVKLLVILMRIPNINSIIFPVAVVWTFYISARIGRVHWGGGGEDFVLVDFEIYYGKALVKGVLVIIKDGYGKSTASS